MFVRRLIKKQVFTNYANQSKLIEIVLLKGDMYVTSRHDITCNRRVIENIQTQKII